MTKDRTEIPIEDRWNVEALYPTMESWEKEFYSLSNEGNKPRWPTLKAFQGKLSDENILKDAVESILAIERKLHKLYTYANLKHNEDIVEDSCKVAYKLITNVLHDFSEETSWFEPELLSLPDQTLEKLINSPALSPYRFHLEKIVRIKKHTLSPEEEAILAASGRALQASHKAFNAISDADLKFGSVTDSEGKQRELSHALFGLYLRDQDRTLRENAFKAMHGKYCEFENTISELLNGQIQSHIFNAKVRRYSSALEAALFPKNIDTSVYHALIEAVHSKMSALHHYIKLRQRILGIKQLHLYDMYVPLTVNIDITLTYPEAEELVIQSVAPLGSEYQNILRKGLLEERWVDRYENKNKRSGAFSGGCYDSMPYILMNFKGILRDVFTLAHEAGHSMHTLLSDTHQPYHYSGYPIFLAEVASTFNEELLIQHMLKQATDKQVTIFLINQKIEDIRATLFRQTMFAEFELFVHEMAEKGIPLTPRLLNERYRQLNSTYFGDSVVLDPESDSEWARIPHFYYNFYVYQYATGISAALALANGVLNGGSKERNAYLDLLKGGCSRYPIDMLRTAGVDMRSPEPVEAAINRFDGLVQELDRLLSEPLPSSTKKEAKSKVST